LFALGSVPPPPPPPGIAPWSDKQRLAAEKETVGFYVSGHPLDKFERDLRRLTSGSIAELGARARVDREKVKVGGVVHTLKLKNNKKGDRYATFNLEDKTGTIEVIMWPEAYRKYEAVIASDEPLCVGGVLEVSEERCQIIADDVASLAAVRQQAVREIRLRLDEAALTAERAHELARMLDAHPGSRVLLPLPPARHPGRGRAPRPAPGHRRAHLDEAVKSSSAIASRSCSDDVRHTTRPGRCSSTPAAAGARAGRGSATCDGVPSIRRR
jgi:hypothetical protein